MFGLSFPELVVIMAVALIVLGPQKLPELARTLGKLMAEVRKASDQVRREFYKEVYKPSEDLRKNLAQETRNLISVDANCETEAKTPAEQDSNVKPKS